MKHLLTARPLLFFLSLALGTRVSANFFNGDFSGPYLESDYGRTATNTGPGQYYLYTNPQDFNPSFAAFGDHTTGTGRMMVVDGGNSVSDLIWWQAAPVTSNNVYTFSVWAASCSATNPAVLRLRYAAGSTLGTFALSTNVGVWTNLTVNLSVNPGTASVALGIANQTTAVQGNAFCLDDISLISTTPNLPLTVAAGGAVEISWNAQTNKNYQVQYALESDTNTWINFGPLVWGGRTNSVLDTIRGQKKFYRVLTMP